MARGLVRRESVETEMRKSEDKGKTFVYTKKKGYDVTRNPHLNKVGVRGSWWEFSARFFEQQALASKAAEFRRRGRGQHSERKRQLILSWRYEQENIVFVCHIIVFWF